MGYPAFESNGANTCIVKQEHLAVAHIIIDFTKFNAIII